MSISANFPNVQPSLLLDFANAKQLPPSVTFTRATTATYYDGHTTALAEQNLIIQSQAFGGSPWSPYGSGIALTSSTETDPAGTSTAGLLTFTGGASGFFYEQFTLPAGVNTFSIYAKGGTKTKFDVRVYNNTSAAYYSSPDFVLTGSWTRYTYTFTNASTSTINVEIHSGTSPEAGTMYFAFMQMEGRSSMTAYTATTTQAITNYIPVLLTAGGGQPRFDHNPTTSESLGLLIEEQRTNLALYSSQFNNAQWTKDAATVTADQNVAPDGTLTADQLYGSTGVGNVYQSYSLSVGTAYTFSVYLKKNGSTTTCQFYIYRTGVSFMALATINLDTGVVTNNVGSGATATPVGNGWYRCTVTATMAQASNTTGIYAFGDVFAWGAQLEEGGCSTSYIPTTSASATRAADYAVVQGANFTNFYSYNVGSVFAKFTFPGISGRVRGVFSINNVTNQNVIDIRQQSDTGLWYVMTQNGISQATITNTNTITSNFTTVAALSYQVNSFIGVKNGSLIDTDGSCTVPNNVTQFQIGNIDGGGTYPLNGWMSKIAYYPQAFTSAQLQALTS